MTREAINELKKYTLGKKNIEKVEISVLQLNRVIKALEQEPCNDAISRQAVINSIANTNFWLSSDNWDELMKAINDVPPVNPQPKTGHWKPTIVRGSESYICSECLAECCYVTTNYCPNCGARMESEVEE